MTVWYQVKDLDASRRFYRDKLGFSEVAFDAQDRWSRLERNGAEIALLAGDPDGNGPVAHIEVDDVKAEAARLRGAGVEVGVVLELHGQVRLVDVFDPDGNRIQLAQELSGV